MKKAALDAMRLAPRCGAKTRSGNPCEGPAMRGKRRCRMHGSGSAPRGNRNAFRHGLRSNETRAMREMVRLLRRKGAQGLEGRCECLLPTQCGFHTDRGGSSLRKE